MSVSIHVRPDHRSNERPLTPLSRHAKNKENRVPSST